jgi:hypothetical protein
MSREQRSSSFASCCASRTWRRGARIGAVLGCDVEGEGDGQVCLVEIGDVVDERLLVPGVDESQRWRAA